MSRKMVKVEEKHPWLWPAIIVSGLVAVAAWFRSKGAPPAPESSSG